jgi:hypothetical protein
MGLKELLAVPEAVQKAGEVITRLDRCFLAGFGRLGPEQTEALRSLERIGSTTPLAAPLSAASEALGRNEFVERHFAALAAARAAIQGAQHDALRVHAARALGRPLPEAGEETPGGEAIPEPIKVWQESTRHWLMEIALAGFGQLEYQTLAPFTATLEQLQGEPRMTRLAALLTGFHQELLRSLPISALPHVPICRWVDLWTRAMVGALRPPETTSGHKVSGTLSPLGVDLHQHGFFVSAVVHALLDTEQPRVIRVTLSSYKVDVVRGPELWQCFAEKAAPLLKAIAGQETLDVSDMTLMPTGDLLWDGTARKGKKRPFLDTAKEWLAPGSAKAAALPSVAVLDRHPVQIAEPVYLEGYGVSDGDEVCLDLGDGAALRVAAERMAGSSELQPEHVAKSQALFGLLRFDHGGWAVQPLAARLSGKSGDVFTGSSAAEPPPAGKKKKATLPVLRERASRLLRKKS